MLQCVAVCCSALQCVAVRCSALQCVAVCCSVMQVATACCSVFPCDAVCCGRHCITNRNDSRTFAHTPRCHTLQHTATHYHRHFLLWHRAPNFQLTDVISPTGSYIVLVYIKFGRELTVENVLPLGKSQEKIHSKTLQDTARHCNTLQHTATHCNTLQHTSTHCDTLQHTATHCNTLQQR